MLKEVKCIQGTDEWFSLRIAKITGSNFCNIMPSPKQRKLPFNDTQIKYLHSVAGEIFTGVDEEDFKSKWMIRGSVLEEFAREAYSKKHNVMVKACGFYTDDMFIGVSPDSIVGFDEKVQEIKCPKAATHVKYMLDPLLLFNEYKWQIIGESFATGIKDTVIISYHPDFPDDKAIIEYEYTCTDDDYNKLKTRLDECIELLKEWVEDKPIQVDF